MRKKFDIIDIGSNIGSVTLPLANTFKNSKIYSIEPTIYAFEKLKILFKIDPISIGGDWIGQMVSYPLPKSMPLNLKEELWNNFKIEVPIFDWNGHRYIRISMQIYNKKSDIDTLLNALDNFLKV